jgi:ketosteroid isomerase-like protein
MGTGQRDLPLDRVELLAAGVSGDLAYTVELEHTSVSVDGVPVEPYTLRVTQVYRREDGEWKVVHRHGDQLPFAGARAFPARPPRGKGDADVAGDLG